MMKETRHLLESYLTKLRGMTKQVPILLIRVTLLLLKQRVGSNGGRLLEKGQIHMHFIPSFFQVGGASRLLLFS